MSNELTKSFEEMTYLEVFEAAVDKNTSALEERFIQEVENSNNKESQWISNLEINNDYEERFPDDELSLLTNTYYEYYSGKSRSIVLARFVASVRFNRERMTLDQSKNLEEFRSEDHYYSFNEMILFGFKRDLLEHKLGRPLNQLEITAIGKVLNSQFNIQPFEKNGEITENLWNNLFFWKRMYYNSANELILTKEYEYSFNDYMIDWDIDLTIPENALNFCVAYINATLEENYSPGYEAEKIPQLFRLDESWTEGDCIEILIGFISQRNITCKYDLDYTIENGIKKLIGSAREQFEELFINKKLEINKRSEDIESISLELEESFLEATPIDNQALNKRSKWKGTQPQLVTLLRALHEAKFLSGNFTDVLRTFSAIVPDTDFLVNHGDQISSNTLSYKKATPLTVFRRFTSNLCLRYSAYLKKKGVQIESDL